jgi:hypothetical protein
MDDLAKQLGTFLLHGAHDTREWCDTGRIIAVHTLASAKAGTMHTNAFEDDQPDTAARSFAVVNQVTLRRQVILAVIRRMGWNTWG